MDGSKIVDAAVEGGVLGLIGGAVAGTVTGVAGLVTKSALASSFPALVVTDSPAAAWAVRSARLTRDIAIASLSGGSGSVASEVARQWIHTERFSALRVLAAGSVGLLLGGLARAGAKVLGDRRSGGVYRFANDRDVNELVDEAIAQGRVPRDTLVVTGGHGRGGKLMTGAGDRDLMSLYRAIEWSRCSNIVITACRAGRSIKLGQLAEVTGRTITAYEGDPFLAKGGPFPPTTFVGGEPLTPKIAIGDLLYAPGGSARASGVAAAAVVGDIAAVGTNR
jgi:hypothetical protein